MKMLEYLTASGAIVLGAANAKAALELTTTHVLDAVLVDLRMPREDGRWLLRELRASQTASANVPVFAVSGERHDRLDPQTGFSGHFVKPVDLDVLVSVLAALPQRSR
jgi:CheY-like chemotaxis protein